MTNELTFTTNSLFNSVTFDKDADGWIFCFADEIYVNVSGFWRLLVDNKIFYVSLDNGHRFGLPNPLDLAEELRKQLAGKRLIKIEIAKNTYDLTLTLTDGHKLEIYIASSGYETYQFSLNNKRYIGLGSGDIAILNS